MNQTKKITQGAMMLAIMGALIIIDRMTGYFFDYFIVLIVPMIIILYSSMNTLKDGMILSVGIMIIAFLLGNFQFTYLIYVPVGIFTGIAYAYGVSKNLDKRSLMIIAVVTYVIGEVVATFVVYPLLGFPVAEMLEQYRIALNEASGIAGINYSEIFSMAGFDFVKMIGIVYVISIILTGAMEGFLIHILSVAFLKRFKIKDLGRTNIWEVKENPPLAYISLLASSLIYVTRYTDNEVLYYVCTIASIFGTIVLFYYGYIFLILFGSMVLRRNIGAFAILIAFFIPSLIIVIIILGFLYASGPLRKYLERKVEELKALNDNNNTRE
ncbi:MAG: DUF2232 domain-containing protein [Erysipelotrichaceae bacterium]|nr:DUF2232 domain-containing protein [Erysipelotrichaceae bacterium]